MGNVTVITEELRKAFKKQSITFYELKSIVKGEAASSNHKKLAFTSVDAFSLLFYAIKGNAALLLISLHLILLQGKEIIIWFPCHIFVNHRLTDKFVFRFYNEYKWEETMPIDSITKRYVINDDKACERLIAAINDPNRIRKQIAKPNAYEEGLRLFKQYLAR